MKPVKTNAMRALERAGIAYEPIFYDLGDAEFSGAAVAEATGVPQQQSFKTLTARGAGVFVFVVPVSAELDLKKAAACAGQKKVEMLHVRELPAVTGYNRGEVSPVGMKKHYPTFIDVSAEAFDFIVVSAGKKGASMKIGPADLARLLGARFAGLSK
ncbi:MAG: aminoacyl-tRNA deacylase [Christensenellales bacterium]|jgi:Cys-tRNA(Pro)/Cys-tRNA(Cys) deacylase